MVHLKNLREALTDLSMLFSDDEIKVYHLRIDAYVTSQIGRMLAKKNPDKVVILVHEVPKIGGGFIYLRSLRSSLKDLIRNLRGRG